MASADLESIITKANTIIKQEKNTFNTITNKPEGWESNNSSYFKKSNTIIKNALNNITKKRDRYSISKNAAKSVINDEAASAAERKRKLNELLKNDKLGNNPLSMKNDLLEPRPGNSGSVFNTPGSLNLESMISGKKNNKSSDKHKESKIIWNNWYKPPGQNKRQGSQSLQRSQGSQPINTSFKFGKPTETRISVTNHCAYCEKTRNRRACAECNHIRRIQEGKKIYPQQFGNTKGFTSVQKSRGGTRRTDRNIRNFTRKTKDRSHKGPKKIRNK